MMIRVIARGADGKEVYDYVKKEYLPDWIRRGYVIAIPYDQISVKDIKKLAAEGISLVADRDRQVMRIVQVAN